MGNAHPTPRSAARGRGRCAAKRRTRSRANHHLPRRPLVPRVHRPARRHGMGWGRHRRYGRATECAVGTQSSAESGVLMAQKIGHVWVCGWAGSFSFRVIVLRSCPKRSKIRLLRKTPLPRHGWKEPGFECWVPTIAISYRKNKP